MRIIILLLLATFNLAYAGPGRPEPEARTQMRILYIFVDLSEAPQPDITRAIADLKGYFTNAAKSAKKNVITANPVVLDGSTWVKIDPTGLIVKTNAEQATALPYSFELIAKAAVDKYEADLGLDVAQYEAIVLVHDLFDGEFPVEMKRLLQVKFKGNIFRTLYTLNYKKLGIRDT